MKKILLFINSLGPGGAERQLAGLACMLKKNGYTIEVLCYDNNLFYKPLLDKEGVKITLLNSKKSKYQKIISAHNKIKAFNPDIVISYLEMASIITCIDKLIFRAKYILFVSERNTTTIMNLSEKIRFFLFKIANIIIPNSYSQKDFINKNFPDLSKKTRVISNFVDTEHFNNDLIRERHNIPKILIAAGICESKNTIGLIEAAKILKEKNIKCIFEWYGVVKPKSEYTQTCEKKVKEYELEEYFKFHEKTTKIKEAYLNADYFCLPSIFEGTPNVIAEAMACKLPIICSNVCDNHLYVTEGKTGFLFNPQKYNDIADAIIKALNLSDNAYKNMCETNRKVAEEKFSPQNFIDKYINIIESYI
jgi:glycosyltransferase involved in cell wall biosynthesis